MTAAAAPRPPSYPASGTGANGITRSRIGENGSTSNGRANGEYSGDEPRGGGRPPPKFPHFEDVVAKAVPPVGVNASIKNLLVRADASLRQARAHLDFRRPDLAYVEYLIGSEILLDMVKRNREWPQVEITRGEQWRFYNALLKQQASDRPKFDEVKKMIKEDNVQSGIQPMRLSPSKINVYNSGAQVSSLPYDNGHTAEMPTIPNKGTSPTLTAAMPSEGSPRRKPAINPKPDSLHAKPLANASWRSQVDNSGSIDALAERFAKLRTLGSSEGSTRGPQFSAQRPDSPGRSLQGLSTLERNRAGFNAIEGEKPAGPRAMPGSFSGGFSHPKISLDTMSVASFPKEPSPTYSPARNLTTPASINPPRTTARSIVGTGGRANAIASSSASSYAPGSNSVPDSYFPRISKTPSLSNGLPEETAITVEKLNDSLKKFNVLLIDVRTREEFDQGHIYARSNMCVEPIALRIGMSAEELEEKLVLSPEAEQMMYSTRNEYDLVVYYDQWSKSTQYLNSPPKDYREEALRALYEALSQFNYDKPLKRPPVLLSGGLDAWVDIVGQQALKTSDSTVVDRRKVQVHLRRSSRPLGRVPMATPTLSLEARRRKLREHRPLDPEEEKAWLERVREDFGSPVSPKQPSDDGGIESPDGASPVIRSYEEFLRRFPEPSQIQQSMTVPTPPSYPPPIPAHHVPPLPSAPSRPPPAVPRTRYGGVSEWTVSQPTPSAPPPPLSLSMLYPRFSNVKLPRTGLINFSVTCYMNSTIQALSATIPFTKYFLDGSFERDVQHNWKGSQGVMPKVYASTIGNLWRGDVEAIRPKTFRDLCARLKKDWGDNNHQQDAKEFLEFLLDCLHEDLNVNWERSPLQQLTAQQELTREKMPMQLVSRTEWARYSHRDLSFVSKLFAGQHASRLRCTTCKHTSTTYEAFYSISVEIPKSGQGDITSCLQSYCQEEMLRGDEVWRCPNCNCEREATKQITITRAPLFLIVHFKRFSASKTESARKVFTPIEFPLKGLDLEPFMMPSASSEVEAKIREQYPTNDINGEGPDPATTGPFMYDAYAVVRHIGSSMGSGHYISLVKDAARGCWRQFNDSRVNDFDPVKQSPTNRLQNEQAYLVFYTRAA